MAVDRHWSLNRLKLAPRIGVAILLTISAAYLLNQGLRAMIPPPPFLVVQRTWLIDIVADGARRAATLPNPTRGDVSLPPPASRYLEFTIGRKVRDPDTGEGALIGDILRRSIARALNYPVERVQVAMEPYDQNNLERTVRTAVVIIPELPTLLTAEALANTKSSVLGDFAISVQLDNGAWMTVTPRNLTGPWWHYARYLFGVAGYLLIIVAFSVWMARSIVAPLSRLAAAAEKLGRSREPTLITGMRLPEYVAIAGTFNTMQLRLKRFLDERMGMLAAISHDLRTPLTRLRLMAEYVGDPAQRDQLLLNISEMETMVSDALAFMGAEARREPIETVDVAALLISLTDDYGDAGEQVTYHGPDHADLPCRPVALKRAFSNLISNGCKYGGTVRVSLRTDSNAIAVDIHDIGTGIPPDQVSRALEPFERLETSRSSETGGSGLGLPISRDIVLGHGGEMGFSWPATGFTVSVSLPRPA